MEPTPEMVARSAEQADRPRWRIVKEPPRGEADPARFAVLRDDRRVAWGLRDRAAAARWLRRLSAPYGLSLS